MSEYIYADVCKSGEDSHGNLVSLPTMVRREEIVRCRDCKYFRKSYSAISSSGYWCSEHDDPTNGNGFCHLAERRDAE